MFTKRWHIETDPCEALARDVYHSRACGDYESDVQAMEGALDNLRDIVQATFAHLDRSTQIEILKTLGWEQK